MTVVDPTYVNAELYAALAGEARRSREEARPRDPALQPEVETLLFLEARLLRAGRKSNHTPCVDALGGRVIPARIACPYMKCEPTRKAWIRVRLSRRVARMLRTKRASPSAVTASIE